MRTIYQEVVLGALSFNSSLSFSLASAGANLTSLLDDETSTTLKKSLQATLAQGTGISKDEVWSTPHEARADRLTGPVIPSCN